MRLSAVTSPEAERLRARPVTAILPIGAVEQHAQHLPVSTDYLAAEAVAARVEARLGDEALLLPGLPYGASDHHEGFAGTVSIGTELLAGLITKVAASLRRSTCITRFLIINGHGGNVPALRWSVERIASELPDIHALGVSYWDAMLDGLRSEGRSAPAPMGHADRYETSIMLSLVPGLAVKDPAPGAFRDSLPDWLCTTQGFAERTTNGGVGNPEGASHSEGTKLLNLAAERIVQVLSSQPPVGWREPAYRHEGEVAP